MSHILRKYQKYILIGISIIILPTFVLWGGSFQQSALEGEAARLGGPVAMVGSAPIYANQLSEQLNAIVQDYARQGRDVSFRDLAEDGTADRVLNVLINDALLDQKAAQLPHTFTRDYLVAQLKRNPLFQNESGQYDPVRFNEWVQQSQDTNWNAVYVGIEDQLRRRLLQDEVLASARVHESELRKEFEERNTKIQVKYVKIQPEAEPTEEQVQAQYDQDPSAYALPEQRRAEFVKISLQGPRPELVDELVARARGGEDFAELAKAHSTGYKAAEGGDMGWVAKGLATPKYQQALFDLAVGAVSDPVEGPAGYLIYKVEEERTSELTGERDVRARQIYISRPPLEEVERTARQSQAEAIASQARDSGDLRAAAGDLEVYTAGPFSVASTEIEGVPDADVSRFTRGLASTGAGEVADPVPAVQNLYVARVTEVAPAEPQPIEVVREKVIADARRAIRRSPEYAENVRQIAVDVAARAQSVEAIPDLFPDLNLEVRETKEFTVMDFDFSGGVLWNPRDVYAAVGREEPGHFAGPIPDLMRGGVYFIELMKRVPPDERVWNEEWPQEADRLRNTALQIRQREHLQDYVLYLRERAAMEIPIQIDRVAVAQILGLDQPDAGEPATQPRTPVVPPMPTGQL